MSTPWLVLYVAIIGWRLYVDDMPMEYKLLGYCSLCLLLIGALCDAWQGG